ncbi:MAG: tetratricopeptide repeat protein, partial [Candidatus Omnitrophica bacterium]|nr:tetratricopeptide repeat protein [Candidatus Omnitrophota bacterium]
NYNQAVEKDPDYVPAYLNRATVFKNSHDYVRATEDLNIVLQIDPHNDAAQNNLRILQTILERQLRDKAPGPQ